MILYSCLLNYPHADIRLILKYATEKAKMGIEAKVYRIYVTDTLKLIAKNTARFGGGSAINSRYYDIITPMEDVPEESEDVPEESADEIISRIKNKLAEFGGDE